MTKKEIKEVDRILYHTFDKTSICQCTAPNTMLYQYILNVPEDIGYFSQKIERKKTQPIHTNSPTLRRSLDRCWFLVSFLRLTLTLGQLSSRLKPPSTIWPSNFNQ